MKFLLIEDEAGKRSAICNHIQEVLGTEAEVFECESLRAGLKELVSDRLYDLILLDMSMPGFDVSLSDPLGGEPESFAGQEIMAQMKLRGIRTPTAVVTQYKAFAKGSIGLSDLVDRYKREYSDFFVGVIYYSTAAETWKREMADLIARYRP